jgi:hypothetical protein
MSADGIHLPASKLAAHLSRLVNDPDALPDVAFAIDGEAQVCAPSSGFTPACNPRHSSLIV